MTAWSVDVIGVPDERDSHDVRCNDTVELARVVGVAAALSQARVIQIRRIPDDGSPLDEVTMSFPLDELRALRNAWVAGGTDYALIVAAVRDLFDGQDGDLHRIAALDPPLAP